jgi:SAM-dependent methyltransferase
MPGASLDIAKMPGHWVLAQMGKRVLRPGGVELTERMLDALEIGPTDRVVELAPGLGATARLTLSRRPRSYVGVDRDPAAAEIVRSIPARLRVECVVGTAQDTGLEGGSADVVYGEAMLTMQTAAGKAKIATEAYRLLAPGGRYGIHELSVQPDDLDDAVKDRVYRDLSEAIRVGARPLTRSEWVATLTDAGFEIEVCLDAPMHLLEPARIIRDEGVAGAARIAWNVASNPAARRRVLGMREVFRRHAPVLGAIAIVARRPA